jgi:hypothetical protein
MIGSGLVRPGTERGLAALRGRFSADSRRVVPKIGDDEETFGGMGADALEDVAKVGERVDMESLAGGDEAGQDGGGLPAFIAPEEEPVVPSDGDPSQASLGTVVIGLQVTSLARNQGLNRNGLGV